MMAENNETVVKIERVTIIGSGIIGRSWAMLFAAAGYHVVIYDIEPTQVKDALDDILVQIKHLRSEGVSRGSLSVEQQFGLISGSLSLEDAMAGAVYVQECVPENLPVKTTVFTALAAAASDACVLASSTSAIPCSRFTEDNARRAQCVVVHPVNPPFYCPATEVIPSPWTADWVTRRTLDIMREIGQKPVLVKKELPGFIINRLQYSLLQECWRLIKDDVISVEDLDTVMRDGLGMRYAFCGPMETCHLNADGMQNYCDRYGETIHSVSSTLGPVEPWSAPEVSHVAADLGTRIPLSQLGERRAWRDARLAALTKLKQNMH